MGMISAQIDELRATAEEIDWEFPFVASRLRGAADTIWELSDDLQRANAENAKLRELGKQYELVIVDYRAEVAKLREFASEAFSMAFNFYHGAGTAEDLRELKVEYRELEIEAGE